MQNSRAQAYILKLKFLNKIILFIICACLILLYPLPKLVTANFQTRITEGTQDLMAKYKNFEASTQNEKYLKDELVRVTGTVILSLNRLSSCAGIIFILVLGLSVMFLFVIFLFNKKMISLFDETENRPGRFEEQV